jgi:hypothetical protein
MIQDDWTGYKPDANIDLHKINAALSKHLDEVQKLKEMVRDYKLELDCSKPANDRIALLLALHIAKHGPIQIDYDEVPLIERLKGNLEIKIHFPDPSINRGTLTVSTKQ